jgi:thymidylate synthase
MNWQADSFHIYGKDIADAKKRLFDRIENSTFEERVYNFNDPDVQFLYHECEEELLNKFKETEKTFLKG